MQNGLNNFELNIQNRAEIEINEISDYYESLVEGLGTKFYIEVSNYIETLKSFPFFEKRYSAIRILPLKKFPYSIHFSVDEINSIVTVHAVILDYRNPDLTRIKL